MPKLLLDCKYISGAEIEEEPVKAQTYWTFTGFSSFCFTGSGIQLVCWIQFCRKISNKREMKRENKS